MSRFEAEPYLLPSRVVDSPVDKVEVEGHARVHPGVLRLPAACAETDHAHNHPLVAGVLVQQRSAGVTLEEGNMKLPGGPRLDQGNLSHVSSRMKKRGSRSMSNSNIALMSQSNLSPASHLTGVPAPCRVPDAVHLVAVVLVGVGGLAGSVVQHCHLHIPQHVHHRAALHGGAPPDHPRLRSR